MSDEGDKPSSEIPATRRNFLRSTARAGLAGLAAPTLAGTWLTAYSADRARMYARGIYALELDGVMVGTVSGISGGDVVADVITEKPGPDGIQRKHIAAPKVEPISIEVGLPVAKPLQTWLKSSFEPNNKFVAKNGALLTFDVGGRIVARREFFNALITEVEFPACDAASKEVATLTVTFVPERLVFTAPRAPARPPEVGPRKQWQSTHYRLNIQGLEAATAKARKIEALAIKMQMASSPTGEARQYATDRVKIEFPNLVVSVPEASARPFYDWHQDFVVAGNNGQDREKVGVLEYLSPDLKSVLLTVNFFNLGIFRISVEAPPTNVERISSVTASMYCEAITADFKV